jgi:hypothetical protein
VDLLALDWGAAAWGVPAPDLGALAHDRAGSDAAHVEM